MTTRAVRQARKARKEARRVPMREAPRVARKARKERPLAMGWRIWMAVRAWRAVWAEVEEEAAAWRVERRGRGW